MNELKLTLYAKEVRENMIECEVTTKGQMTNDQISNAIYCLIKYLESQLPEQYMIAMEHVIDDRLEGGTNNDY